MEVGLEGRGEARPVRGIGPPTGGFRGRGAGRGNQQAGAQEEKRRGPSPPVALQASHPPAHLLLLHLPLHLLLLLPLLLLISRPFSASALKTGGVTM